MGFKSCKYANWYPNRSIGCKLNNNKRCLFQTNQPECNNYEPIEDVIE